MMSRIVLVCALFALFVASSHGERNDIENSVYKNYGYKCIADPYMPCVGGGRIRGSRFRCACTDGYTCDYSPKERNFICLEDLR